MDGFYLGVFNAIVLYNASKTGTLDLCQLPRPPHEIHKKINLPASVKISKIKLEY